MVVKMKVLLRKYFLAVILKLPNFRFCYAKIDEIFNVICGHKIDMTNGEKDDGFKKDCERFWLSG